MSRTIVPTSSEELAECITDKVKRNEIWNNEDPTVLPEFLTKYAAAHNKADVNVERQVSEQVERVLAQMLRGEGEDGAKFKAVLKRPDMRPATVADVRASRQTGAMYAPDAAGAKLDGKFRTVLDFMDVINAKRDSVSEGNDVRRREVRNAMSSTDPGSGGFLVPEEFRAELLRESLETSVVRPLARVIPMSTLRAAIPMVDATTNNGSVYGGIIAYWTEEGAALTVSQPSFSRVVLEAKKLTAYTEVPNELREDSSPSVEAILRGMFPEAIAFFEDIAFLMGTGVGEPLGALNTLNNAIIAVTKETGQPASTVAWENIVNMYSRMLPSALNRAVWIVSPDTLPQLMTTALTVGVGGAPIGMANFDGQNSPSLSLLGRPVIISEKVNSLTNQGDVNFVDFGHYLIGDRMAMSAESSTEFKFGNDVTSYRFIERVDGRPWTQSAITPKNGGNTLSPFIQLGAR